MQAQQQALASVFGSEAFASGDIDALAREITPLAAATIGVERASVWLFSPGETALSCIDLFESTPASHSSGLELTAAEYANEFAALRTARFVAADDALTDPRTAGYVSTYLKPLRITAMLDALIQTSGQRLGLLCLEHVDREHHWEPDEIFFACELADKIALALLNRSRREMLATLAASESRYRSILDASPDGVAITDLKGQITMVSQTAERMLGRGRVNEIIGRSITDFIVPEDRARAGARIALMFEGAKSGSGEYRGMRLDGSLLDIDVNSAFIRGHDSKPSGIVFMVRDIAERREARDALRRSNDLLGSIVETVPARIFWKGRDLRYLGCNSAFARDAGFSLPDDLVGKTDFEMGWRDQAELYRADDVAVMESGVGRVDYEEPQTTSGGETSWLSTSKVPLRDSDNQVVGILGTYHDITPRKLADDALRDSLTEKESLLKEIHHRVKNNLQIINSLLRLEASRSKEPAVKTALGEMQGRVLSMAVLHETLYRTRTFGRVDLSSYLRDLAQRFLRANTGAASPRLTLDLSPVEVRIDQGIPCGLIVNEILTNSIKYAFLDDRAGEIKIILRPTTNHEILLQVSDNGPGLPEDFEARRDRSLGMQLVTDLTRQIGGRLEIGRGPGARFTFTFQSGEPMRLSPQSNPKQD